MRRIEQKDVSEFNSDAVVGYTDQGDCWAGTHGGDRPIDAVVVGYCCRWIGDYSSVQAAVGHSFDGVVAGAESSVVFVDRHRIAMSLHRQPKVVVDPRVVGVGSGSATLAVDWAVAA